MQDNKQNISEDTKFNKVEGASTKVVYRTSDKNEKSNKPSGGPAGIIVFAVIFVILIIMCTGGDDKKKTTEAPEYPPTILDESAKALCAQAINAGVNEGSWQIKLDGTVAIVWVEPLVWRTMTHQNKENLCICIGNKYQKIDVYFYLMGASGVHSMKGAYSVRKGLRLY